MSSYRLPGVDQNLLINEEEYRPLPQLGRRRAVTDTIHQQLARLSLSDDTARGLQSAGSAFPQFNLSAPGSGSALLASYEWNLQQLSFPKTVAAAPQPSKKTPMPTIPDRPPVNPCSPTKMLVAIGTDNMSCNIGDMAAADVRGREYVEINGWLFQVRPGCKVETLKFQCVSASEELTLVSHEVDQDLVRKKRVERFDQLVHIATEIQYIAHTAEKSPSIPPELVERVNNLSLKIKSIPSQTPEGVRIRKEFIQTFSQDRPGYEQIRKVIGKQVYACIGCQNPNEPWTLKKNPTDPYTAKYFHATKIASLEGILKDKVIRVTDRTYPGAFVSTRPERTYGSFVLGLNDRIEHSGFIGRASCSSHPNNRHCWVGFAEPIPVNERTLEFIAVEKGTPQEIQKLQQLVREWTQRDIKVIPLNQIEEHVHKKTLSEGIIVPKEWEETGWDWSSTTLLNQGWNFSNI